jgi:hypothetical protein
MFRVICGCGCLFGLVVPSLGQQTAAKPETLVHLSVAARAAPEPALKYLLLPELREMNPGNPIQGYLKCDLEQYRFVFDEEEFDRRKSLLAMPLDFVPAREVPELGGFALAQADAAARLDNPDWQILLKLRADGFETLLPDIQALRALGRAVGVRFRSEVAGGRIDDAIRTAKTMFAMAHHTGEHPTLIGNIVGLAIAFTAIGPLEEMLEHPDCPNLYWALTQLPNPLVKMTTGMEGERLSIWGVFRDLDATASMSPEQIKQLIDRIEKLMGPDPAAREVGGVTGYVAARAKDPQKLAAARKRLVGYGLPEPSVAAFPPEQVILLDEERELRVRFDEIAKSVAFPPWQFEAIEEKYHAIKRERALMADAFLPSHAGARRAIARLEQRIAMLRHVEALRMYAAEHKGTFPARLSEVSVPLPNDPITDKPFLYETSGKTAHLRGTPPKALENDKFFRVHYELTLKQ